MVAAEGRLVNFAATSATIGTIPSPSCALLALFCVDADIICRVISSTGRLRASAQISRRSTSTESRGTTLSIAGTKPVIDSALKLELHRQAKVIGRGTIITRTNTESKNDAARKKENYELWAPRSSPL